LLVIADHANDDGTEAWPSQATIAAKCSISVRTVQRVVRTLCAHKYIYLQKRAGGSVDCREDRRPNRYTINMTKLRGDTMTGRHNDADGVTLATNTGRQSRTMNHPKEPSIEPSLFEQFWKIYPRKVAKGAAQKAWEKAVKTAKAQDIIAGAERYAKDGARDPKFTAHPATWLNAQRWLDEAQEPEKAQVAYRAESYNPAIHDPNPNAVPMPQAVKELLQKTLRKKP
jgi:Helix-turn-helix domain